MYEAVPEPEPKPEPEPENDYEDVVEIDRHEQDEEAEADYEDVLEPEDPSFSSTQAGEWWGRRIPPLHGRTCLFSFYMLVGPCSYFSLCRIIRPPSRGWSWDLSCSPV